MSIPRRGLCLVISAPSGAGKTSITRALLADEPGLELSISVTTRARREHEQDGVHYHFRTRDEFEAMRASGALLESAGVFGRWYGTPRAPVEAALTAGRDVVFDIDWQGFRQLRDALPGDVVSLFILPPSLAELEARLHRRGDDADEVARRMAEAKAEMSHAPEFDHVLVNEDFERSVAAARAVLHAARLATSRQSGLAALLAGLGAPVSEAQRRDYADRMLAAVHITDRRVADAFAAVPREAFVGPLPWALYDPNGGDSATLDGSDPARLYDDVLVVLDRAKGLNNGSPSLHALMLHHLAVAPGDRVLHIGIGAGYYTAMLAELAGPQGRITAVEYDARLAEIARANLRPWPNVTVIEGDGAAYPRDTTERVYVNFAVVDPALAWFDCLPTGGTLLFPLAAPKPGGESRSGLGAVLLITRTAQGYAARHLSPCGFVMAEGPLGGSAEMRARLWAAFGRGGIDRVTGLRRGGERSDRDWFWSPGWSLF
jgi:guanylate kinase